MRFIDKSPFVAREDDIDRRFINDCRADDDSLLPPLDSKMSFDAFKKPEYKRGADGWEQLLIDEQSGLCCYCMRRISEGQTSIEHLIPESFSGLIETDEYDFYTALAPGLRDRVELSSRFAGAKITAEETSSMTRFPHLTALGNLFAACNGTGDFTDKGCSCNNCRGNTRILPLMLMENTQAAYSPTGEAYIVREDTDGLAEQTIKALNINKPTLKYVRMVWYHAVLTQVTVEEMMAANGLKERMELMKRLFDTDNFETLDPEIQKFADNDTYHRLLLSYDWFHGYYTSRMPQVMPD
ncbi:MAG: hypothetical protein NC117_08915 [Pseudoflavonifractor sp.]|nr:hypothetical protein [Pseudoflavonifractor sp.]